MAGISRRTKLCNAETIAGISRKALEVTNEANGDGKLAAPASSTTKKPADWQTISAVRETCVIDTPMRKLSVLESHSGYVTLRDLQFVNARADVTHIVMEPEQAHALAAVLAKLEAVTAGDEQPKRRVRA